VQVEAGWATLPPPLAVDARVRRLLGRGVPAALRGRVWFALLRAALEGTPDHGGLRAALEDGGYYARLLARRGRSTHADVQRLVKTDARRTFSEHRHARRLQPAVRRLLDAYSHRNPATGYCQSMNFIAACLLLHMPEPRAFWALCCLLELVLPDGLHASQLHGVTGLGIGLAMPSPSPNPDPNPNPNPDPNQVTIELRLLDDLLSRQHGALLAHLRAAGVRVQMAASYPNALALTLTLS